MNSVIKFIKNNIVSIITSVIIFSVLLCSGLNTFAANDDLPYSLFYRGESRVENILQVVKNQVADYKTINGRFLVHCMIQTLLIFDRVLFSIGNAIVIVATIGIIAYIAEEYICNKKNSYLTLLIMSGICFLLLFDFKWLIYWVAGSVNYVWMFLFVILILLYYLKTNFDKHTILNIIIMFLLANLHELSLVVAVILYMSFIVEQIVGKKFNLKKTLYIIPMIIGAIILLKAPGNAGRMAGYEEWYNLNIIDKMLISVPALSKAVLNVNNGYNIVPALYIFVIVIKLLKYVFDNRINNTVKTNIKINIIMLLALIINIVLCVITKNAWLCVILLIILAVAENYIHIVNKRYKFVTMSLAMYAAAFCMCITPLYLSLRPNYYLYMYYSIIISGFIGEFIRDKNKIANIISGVILAGLLSIELYIYLNIGHVVRIREKEIRAGIENKSNVIHLTRIPDIFVKYHNEANDMGNEDYWCKKFYYYYHGIDSNVDLIVNDK